MKGIIKLHAIRTIAVAVAVVAVVMAAAWLVRTAGKTGLELFSDRSIDVTPEQVESIKAIGEWEFLELSYEEMVDTVRRGLFTDDKLARIYYGTMRIGLDMSEVRPEWITVSGDTVVMTLPPVRLLDDNFIDEARTRAFYERGRWTAADRETMYARAHDKMMRRGLTEENLRTARDNAAVQLRKMVEAMGYDNVVIKFGEQAAGRNP